MPEGVLPWRLQDVMMRLEEEPSAVDAGEPIDRQRELEELVQEVQALSEEGADLSLPEARDGWRRVEALLLASRERRHTNAHVSERIALLAARAAGQLDRDVYGGRLVADLQARAWTYVSVARRLEGDFQGAQNACTEAWGHLEAGTGDVLERALLLECEGTLLKTQWHFPEAARSLRHAANLFSLVGDDNSAGRSLAILANLYHHDDDLVQAIETLREVARLTDPVQDPALHLSIRHNLAAYLVDAGEYEQAQGMIDDLTDLYEQVADPIYGPRRRWVQAQIYRGTRRFEEAESELMAVQESFLEAGMGYDAATVSIDLAILYAEQGRFSEMRRLADEMLPIFRAQDIHREALAALAVFQQAARMEEVTLKLARDLADYFGKARNQPSLKFEPGR